MKLLSLGMLILLNVGKADSKALFLLETAKINMIGLKKLRFYLRCGLFKSLCQLHQVENVVIYTPKDYNYYSYCGTDQN